MRFLDTKIKTLTTILELAQKLGIVVHPGRSPFFIGQYSSELDLIIFDDSGKRANVAYVLLHEIVHATGVAKRLDRPAFSKYENDDTSPIDVAVEEHVANSAAMALIRKLDFPICEATEEYLHEIMTKDYIISEENADYFDIVLEQSVEAVDYIMSIVEQVVEEAA